MSCASTTQSNAGHVPRSSSPRKRKRASVEHTSLSNRTVPQFRRAAPVQGASTSRNDAFERQLDFIKIESGVDGSPTSSLAAMTPEEKPTVTGKSTVPKKPTVTEKPTATITWPQCCTPDQPCIASWKVDPVRVKKYYAVRNGRALAIYYDWNSAAAQVNKFSRADFKSFKTASAAEKYMNLLTVAGCFSARQQRERAVSSGSLARPASCPVHSEGACCVVCCDQKQSCAGAILCQSCLQDDDAARRFDEICEGYNLCEEQRQVMEMIDRGENVFFPGAAGTGKSTVVRAAMMYLRSLGKRIKPIAPTALAAHLLGGTTIHVYVGWTATCDTFMSRLELKSSAHGKKIWNRLAQETDVLIIDEISMVENFTFARLDCLLKAARGSAQPFGGVQLIVTGDFYQLSPVKPFQSCFECGDRLQIEDVVRRGAPSYTCRHHGTWEDADKWAFRSPA